MLIISLQQSVSFKSIGKSLSSAILSSIRLFATLRTVSHQSPLSMGFSRQESWSGLPCPPLGDLPNPGIEPVSFKSPALSGRFFTTSATWEAQESL